MKIASIEVELIDSCGSDLSVVNAARVSMDKESDWEHISCKGDEGAHDSLIQAGWEDNSDPEGWEYTARRLKETDVKLINYLAKHKHLSPFNHAFLSFRIKAPIFVARQLVKHKFLPWNEVSRRYVDSEPEFYIPEGLRKRAENVKQGSLEESVEGLMFINNDGEGDNHGDVTDAVEYSTSESSRIYGALLDKGVCPEQARMVLPLNTMTEWYWSGTLGAWLDMLVLRLDAHSQKETRDVAELIAKEVKNLFPESFKARIYE